MSDQNTEDKQTGGKDYSPAPHPAWTDNIAPSADRLAYTAHHGGTGPELGLYKAMTREWDKAAAQDMDKALEAMEQEPKDHSIEFPATDSNSGTSAKTEDGLDAIDVYPSAEQGEEPIYDKVSDTGKKFYYREPGVRVYESGAVYQEGKGLIKPAKGTTITVDNASEYAEKRHSRAQEKALEGMREAIENNLGVTAVPGDEARYWGQAVAGVMLEPGRNQVAALRLAAEGPLELMSRRKGEDVPSGEVRITATMSIAEFRNRVAGERQGDGGDKSEVIDVEAQEPD